MNISYFFTKYFEAVNNFLCVKTDALITTDAHFEREN